jgi:hypothetical protein
MYKDRNGLEGHVHLSELEGVPLFSLHPWVLLLPTWPDVVANYARHTQPLAIFWESIRALVEYMVA